MMKKRIISALLALAMLCPMLPTGGLMTTSVQAADTGETQTAQAAFGFSTTAPALPATGDPYGSIDGGPVNINVLSELFVASTVEKTVDYSLFDWDTGSAGSKDSSIYFAAEGSKNKQTLPNSYDDDEESSARIVAFDPFGTGKDEYIARHVMSFGYGGEKNHHELQVIEADSGAIICYVDLDYPNIKLDGYMNARNIEGLLAITAGDFNGDGCDEIAVYDVGSATNGVGALSVFQVNDAKTITRLSTTSLNSYCPRGTSNPTLEDFVAVQLTAGQLAGDSAHEELVVTLNFNSASAASAGTNGSRVLVYEGGSMGAPKVVSNFFQNIGQGADQGHDLRAASTTIGDVNFDNKPDLIVAGRFSTDTNQNIYNKDRDIDKAYMAVFNVSGTNLVHKPNNAWKLYDTVEQTIHEATMVQPIALVAFAADGKSAADSVFMDGCVFKYNSGGGFYSYSDDAKASWNRRHNDSRDDCNFIDQAIAGNIVAWSPSLSAAI